MPYKLVPGFWYYYMRTHATCILVPRASVSFGHLVGETEDIGSSNYWMSVNHGHPVTQA